MNDKVMVAIPHYNASTQLDRLLSEITTGNFDRIVVLDDHSSDQAVLEVVKQKYPSVEFIIGKKNLGSGGNRNRILDLDFDGIVWFLDCDMELVTKNNATTLRKIFSKDKNQMIGGQLLARDHSPMIWNYAHEMHPVNDEVFNLLCEPSFKAFAHIVAWHKLKERGWDYPWLRRKKVAKPRQVDWVAEGSFALPMKLFKKVDGYDRTFRYHEGQDLARRIRSEGAKIIIHPDIVTRHLEVDVTKNRRNEDRDMAKFLFFQKHWDMNRKTYNKLFDKEE